MSDSSIPTPVGITLDMHARGVRALTEPSGDVYSVRALDPEVAEQVVTQVLGAALAGRTVVDKPGSDHGNDWYVRDNLGVLARHDGSKPVVVADMAGGRTEMDTYTARLLGPVLLAAADRAEWLAAESSACCDLHGEHCEPPADLCCTDCSAGVLPWTGQVTT